MIFGPEEIRDVPEFHAELPTLAENVNRAEYQTRKKQFPGFQDRALMTLKHSVLFNLSIGWLVSGYTFTLRLLYTRYTLNTS